MSIAANGYELSVTEASQRGVAGLVSDAEHGSDVVVTRHKHPVAAVIAYYRLQELEQTAEDLRDLALVLARQATDSGERTSFDEVLAAFGQTRASLDALPDAD